MNQKLLANQSPRTKCKQLRMFCQNIHQHLKLFMINPLKFLSCEKDKKNASFAPLVLVFPEATGQIVFSRVMPVKDMSSIMSSLPTMKSNDPNCDFWDRLWISAKANGLTINELYAICEQIAPPNFSGQMVNLVQPTNAPSNSNDYARQLSCVKQFSVLWGLVCKPMSQL